VTWWGIAGALIQIVGTGIAAWALRDNLRTYGDGRPIIPALHRPASWVRRKFGRAPTQAVIPSGAGTGATAWEGTGSGYAPVSDDSPVQEQLSFLRDRVSFLVAMEGRRSDDVMQRKISDLAEEADRKAAEFSKSLAAVAAGRARQELFGLFLVVVGTVVAAFG
jgi:hypothetical protein